MNESIEQKITAVIESVPKPEFVASVSFRLAEDWSGDPAVMILVLLKDHAKPDKAYWDALVPFDQKLSQAVYQAQPDYLPYLTFRMESEQAELDQETAQVKSKLARRKTRNAAVAA